MGEGQDRKNKPEVLTQPMHQGFVYHNSLTGSSGTGDVKKMENMFLFHILGKRLCTGEPWSKHLPTWEKCSKRVEEDPMPWANWPHKFLYTAATELLMDAAIVKVGFDL